MRPYALLTTAYLPPISFFSAAAQSREVRIEQWERFQKQSVRNRCYILSANGVLPLTVPVVHSGRSSNPIRDLRISYSQPWPRLHWRALCAAYNNSPFFEHYSEGLYNILFAQERFLIDLNTRAFEFLLEQAGIRVSVMRTREYAGDGDPFDFRRLSVRGERQEGKDSRSAREYLQVFQSRFGFVAGLSMMDLLCNTGPACAGFLDVRGQPSGHPKLD